MARGIWACDTGRASQEREGLSEEVPTKELALRVRSKERFCEFIHAFVNKHSDLKETRDWDTEFRKIKKLGEGGNGVVWKVEQAGTGRRFALKEIEKPDTARNFENCSKWKSLLTEIEVLSELQLPFCIKLHGLRNNDTHLGLLLELVRGTNLQHYAAVNPVSERDASEIATHVLCGLRYLHEEKNIVHRDIKPENILIHRRDTPVNCDRFVVKLVDFGSSRFAREGLLGGRYGDDLHPMGCPEVAPAAEAPAATPVGSALYLALETINISLSMDDAPTPVEVLDQLPKVDIFSLGVVVYVLMCRIHPFLGTIMDSPDSLRSKMVDEAGNSRLEFPSDAELDFPLSDEAKDFLVCSLAHCPKERISASGALRHPWLVGRRSCCEAPRAKCIDSWEESCYKAPEEKVLKRAGSEAEFADSEPSQHNKRRAIMV